MNRIQQLFNDKSEGVLSIFTTAGFPKLHQTMEVLQELQSAGVDMVELGIPFSDPLADGPIIQNSSSVAIENGMTLKVLFEQIKDLRQSIKIPIVLMGYINPVMQYGMENFCKKCAEVGVDGIILPDLPFFEYQKFYQKTFEDNGLINVFLITPQTSDERIKILDIASKGFLYLVSSASTTGNNKVNIGTEVYLDRIKKMKLQSKTLVGFNINSSETFKMASNYSNGAIIGSAFIKTIENSTDLKKDISEFVNYIKS